MTTIPYTKTKPNYEAQPTSLATTCISYNHTIKLFKAWFSLTDIMASRILSSSLRASMRRTPFQSTTRNFATTPLRLEGATVAAPVKKPVGAFRGGWGTYFLGIKHEYTLKCRFPSLTGFLLGSVLSGAGMYYYVMNEYRVSNELLTEDIFVRTRVR